MKHFYYSDITYYQASSQSRPPIYHCLELQGFDYQGPSLQDPDYQDEDGQGLKLIEKKEASTKPPSMYKVVLLNDDYTPMEFVIDILIRFFRHNEDQATQIMLAVHQQGKGVCGIYTKDIAETKAAQVNQYARQNKHPLLCDIEPLD